MSKPVEIAPASRPVKAFALLFGLFLGLCILKFGNPVVLDHKISIPQNPSDLWNDAWPTHWSLYFLLPIAAAGALLTLKQGVVKGLSLFYWLPLGWFGWQLFAAASSVDETLTTATLGQYFGCLISYFIGLQLLQQKNTINWLLIGVFAATSYCLVRALEQHVYEYPANYQALAEGQRVGWTNTTPETVLEMKQEGIIIATNGLDVANPVILNKFAKGRVSGTLVYPNALAGVILLLFPVALTLALKHSQPLRPPIRIAALSMVCLLSALAFLWTGSKLGWLLAIILVGVYLLKLPWSVRLKWAAVGLVLVVGLGVFAIRFHSYFAKGATSVGARFDYWRAAVKTTANEPLHGTGPGTFQHPYALIKSPEAEMARLAHNDYLQQFSDSGILGGLFYLGWIASALAAIGRNIWKSSEVVWFAIFAGILVWFLQGLGEFGLFIPGTAWIAFTLLGASIGRLRFNSTPKAP